MIYIYINVGGKVKYISHLKKIEYSSHTHVKLTCGLIVFDCLLNISK